MSKKLFSGLAAFAALSATSMAQVTLPNLGLDVPGHATAMGTDLATIFTTILGISAVFIAANIGWKWLRRARG